MIKYPSLHRTVAFGVLLAICVIADPALAQWAPSGDNINNTNTGNVGIGTTSPTSKLHVVGGLYIVGGPSFLEQALSSLGGGAGVLSVVDTSALAPDVGGTISLRGIWRSDGATGLLGGIKAGKANATSGDLDSYLALYSRSAALGILERLRIDHNGNVGIGTTAPTARLHVVGDATFTGTVSGANIIAKYQDIAEWVPAEASLIPGTVVVLDPEHDNRVLASTRAYDTAVAGVVSAQPGLILGETGDDKARIATTGRVRVQVDARRQPIHRGDLLVSGELPGTAMRSEPVTLDGISLHRPGTLIGKALEPLESGVGTILVLLSLQ